MYYIDPYPNEGGWDKPDQPQTLIECPNSLFDPTMESVVTTRAVVFNHAGTKMLSELVQPVAFPSKDHERC